MSSVHAAPLELIRESERLFLHDLLTAPDGVAGLTSAPPPYYRKPFPLGGKWGGHPEGACPPGHHCSTQATFQPHRSSTGYKANAKQNLSTVMAIDRPICCPTT